MFFLSVFLFSFFFPFCSDIFDNQSEKSKYSFNDNDFGTSTGAIWNPYNIDLNSLTGSGRDNGGSASSTSLSFDTYNPKYNNNPEDAFFDSYRSGVVDWEEYSPPRQRGATELLSSGSSSNRAKKTLSSKRTVTKIIPKPKQRPPKQKQPNKEPDRDLMPPPQKK